MRTTGSLTVALAAAAAMTAAAQQTTPGTERPGTTSGRQQMTISGCVGTISGAQGQYMMSNPVVVSTGSAQPSAPGAAPGAGAPTTPGIPPAGSPNAPATPGSPAPTPGSTPGTPPTPGGNAGASPPGTPGAPTAGTPAGVAGAAGVPGGSNAGRPAGTPTSPGVAQAPVGVGAAPPSTSSGSTTNGYRLTGTNLSQWSGQRVEIAGTMVSAGSTSTAPGLLSMPEFRVASIHPVTGTCQ